MSLLFIVLAGWHDGCFYDPDYGDLRHFGIPPKKIKLLKIMKLKITSKVGAVLVSTLMLSAVAQAAYINGSIAFNGNVATTPSGPLAAATGFTFTNVTIAANQHFGSYLSVPNNDPATFNPVTFIPATSGGQLWIFTDGPNTYSFDITSMSVNPLISFGTPTTTIRTIYGTGTAFITGFDPTPGTWSVTATESGGASLSFSSSAAAAGPVPDGGATVALFGASLLGLYGVRRKFVK